MSNYTFEDTPLEQLTEYQLQRYLLQYEAYRILSEPNQTHVRCEIKNIQLSKRNGYNYGGGFLTAVMEHSWEKAFWKADPINRACMEIFRDFMVRLNWNIADQDDLETVQTSNAVLLTSKEIWTCNRCGREHEGAPTFCGGCGNDQFTKKESIPISAETMQGYAERAAAAKKVHEEENQEAKHSPECMCFKCRHPDIEEEE